MKYSLLLFSAIIFLNVSCAQESEKVSGENQDLIKNSKTMSVERTEEEWKKILSPEQYEVLRLKGTERPFTGKYNIHKEKGTYVCAACGMELFSSDMKFESNCGWPSFDEEIAGGKIIKKEDRTHGMIRTEILCANCGSHLGHLFDDGPTETGMRYCVNSVSLDFKGDTLSGEKK
ncbi:MAG TPA: peptide-methionine (R)-S-oxide reductase MsrB [Bacteroidia bacterium]|nr:peptide-methionine (R)-S-oxide reductase MsrB [Bacteroidia bacterium]